MTFPPVSLSPELSIDGVGVNSLHFLSTGLELMAPRNIPNPALRLLIRGGSPKVTIACFSPDAAQG